ncbi:MAG: hypothetical protein ACI4MT_04400 [Christensenellales bacterium]
MKKIVLIILVVILAAVGIGVLVACNPATLENIVGTYEISVNTTGNEDLDLISTNGLETYIVVTGNESGYFIYKDSSTPLIVKEVELVYWKNNNNEVTQVEIKDKQGWVKSRVGSSNKLFVNKTSDGMELKYEQKKVGDIIVRKNTVYNRISESTNLNSVKAVYGEILPSVIKNDDASLMHGVWNVNEYDGKYDYRYMDFNILTNKATDYYVEAGEGTILKKTYDFEIGDFDVDAETGEKIAKVVVKTDKENVEYELCVSDEDGKFNLRRKTQADPEEFANLSFESSLTVLNVESCISYMLNDN